MSESTPTRMVVTNAAEAESLSSRRKLVGIAALGALAAVPGVQRLLRVGDAFAAAPSKAQDVRILQLVLQLEYTQVAFYEQAVQKASLQGELLEFARAALVHERAHLAAIKQALGAKAGPRPRFAFGAKVREPRAVHAARRSSSRTSPSPATTGRRRT